MKKYNKYGADHKNNKLNLYDIELVSEYNGSKVDKNEIVAKIVGDEETFHIFILPDHDKKTVSLALDSNSSFAQNVVQLMMQSGEAEYLVKQVYDELFTLKAPMPPTINLPDFPVFN